MYGGDTVKTIQVPLGWEDRRPLLWVPGCERRLLSTLSAHVCRQWKAGCCSNRTGLYLVLSVTECGIWGKISAPGSQFSASTFPTAHISNASLLVAGVRVPPGLHRDTQNTKLPGQREREMERERELGKECGREIIDFESVEVWDLIKGVWCVLSPLWETSTVAEWEAENYKAREMPGSWKNVILSRATYVTCLDEVGGWKRFRRMFKAITSINNNHNENNH